MLAWPRLGQAYKAQAAALTQLRSFSSPFQWVDTRGIDKQKLENIAPDRIHLTGLLFFGRHGVLPEENTLGQRFHVDVTLHCDLQSAGRRDDLEATTDYSVVYKNIKEVVEGRPSLLIEQVAENIASSVLSRHRGVLGIRVAVKKPHVAIPGIFDSVLRYDGYGPLEYSI